MICVWQSQAFVGTSNFTAVAGCDAFAKPDRPPIPGDLMVWSNPDGTAAYKYENATYIGIVDGQRMFHAHPFGEKSEKYITDEMNGHRISEPKEEAFLQKQVLYPDYKLIPWE